MERKDEELTSVNGSTYTLTFESFETYLKLEKNTSVADKKRLRSYKSIEKMTSSSSKSKCPKLCTEYREISLNGPQTSDCKPQALRESAYRQKKAETKPAGEMPLFDRLKTKMKETSRKLQETTRHTVAEARSLFVGLRKKRALGFKCDLKKCDSTLIDCSAGTCRKRSMLFGEPSRPSGSKTVKFSVSDTLTVSSTSEDSS